MEINNQNIEEYILLMLDHELDEAATKELTDYISKHPQHQQTLDAFKHAYLSPEETIDFPDKESLLKAETRVVEMKAKLIWYTWSAAAAIVLLLGTGVVIMKSKPDAPGQKLTYQQPSKTTSPSIIPAIATKDTSLIAALQQVKKVSHKDPVKFVANIKRTAKRETPIRSEKQVQKQDISPLTDASIANLSINDKPIPADEIAMNTDIEPVHGKQSKDEVLWIKKDNLQGLNDIVGRLQVLKENVIEKAQDLKITAFVFHIGGQNYTLGKEKN